MASRPPSPPLTVASVSGPAGPLREGAPPRSYDVWWRITAGATVLLCVYLHWQVGRSAEAPRTPWDEIHPLQTARFLAGQGDVLPLSGSGYFPGWSILLAPVWWFTEDAEVVYRVAVTYGDILALLTIIPFALVARRMGLTSAQAVTVAALTMSFPGRVVLADYALSEQALLFMLAWAVLAMHALWSRPTWWRTVLFVLTVAATYLIHSRELAVVATAAVWMLMLAVRHWRVAAIGLPLLGLLTLSIRSFSNWLLDETLVGGAGGKEDLLGRVFENGSPSLLLRMLLNQTWAQVVGTAGLASLGAVILIIWSVHELRRWQIGPGVFLFGTCVSALLLSAVWWTRPDFLFPEGDYLRLDVWIYTRYVDQIGALLVLVALIVLVRGPGRGMILTALALFGMVAASVVLWVAQDIPLWGALDGPGNSSALLSWTKMFPEEPFPLPQQPRFDNENRFWIWASLFGAAMLTLALVLRRHPRVLTSLLLITAFVLSLEADPSQKRDAPRRMERAIERIEATTGVEQIDIDMDYSCRGPALTRYQVMNWLGYWMSPRDIDLADPPAGVDFDSDFVVSCGDWPLTEENGARKVADSGFYSYALWVLPGDAQDELDEAGLLAE